MDKILITNLIARGVIGVTERERRRPQDIRISVTLFTDTRRAGKSDNIRHTVDYSATAKKLLAHAESIGRQTVEALANDLAEICLNEPKVVKVIVRVEKPGAVRFAESVGVEIERSREA
jgi:FolB domain-containing protein